MRLFVPESLADIRDKLALGQRLDEAEALRLFECDDLNALGQLADEVNRATPRTQSGCSSVCRLAPPSRDQRRAVQS